MSDPKTWPTTPPSEPGWYWVLAAPTHRRIPRVVVDHRPEIVYVGRYHADGALEGHAIGGKYASPVSGEAGSGYMRPGMRFYGARWHPARIEQP